MKKEIKILLGIIEDLREVVEALKEENARLKELNKRNERLIQHLCAEHAAKGERKGT